MENSFSGILPKEAQAIVSNIRYKVDVNSLRKLEDVEGFDMNDIGRVSLRVSQPIFPRHLP